MSLDLIDQVFKLETLPSNEKAVLTYLAFRAKDDGTSIFPGIESICLAVNHKRCQTLRLLRKLKEKGYIIQVNAAGGPRNVAVYHIPLNQAGIIDPKPIELEKTSRKRKKPAPQIFEEEEDYDSFEFDPTEEEEQPGQGEIPVPTPAAAARQERLPVPLGTGADRALVPAPAPAREPPGYSLADELLRDKEEQIRIWTDKLNYFSLRRDGEAKGSKARERWNHLALDANEQLSAWKSYVPAANQPEIEYVI